MPGMARIGDRTTGVCRHPSHDPAITVGGSITTGSSSVTDEGKGVARIGDTVTSDCGHIGNIVTASSQISAEGSLVARQGDSFSGVYSGNIISSSGPTSLS
jgi:hypothetical protein